VDGRRVGVFSLAPHRRYPADGPRQLSAGGLTIACDMDTSPTNAIPKSLKQVEHKESRNIHGDGIQKGVIGRCQQQNAETVEDGDAPP
jgi:hypothetical protein